MRTSEQLQMDVLDELAYAGNVDSSHIAVTAHGDGIITLRGSVPSYMQCIEAEKAAGRIRGVKAVANEIEVRWPTPEHGDAGVAEAALRALQSSASVPRDRIKVTVSKGWVVLAGKVQWAYERQAAYNVVSDLLGVRGVTNRITIESKVKVPDIERKIRSAFHRNAQVDAEHVTVEASGDVVTLRGTVRSLAEKEAAESAAWRGGASIVDNQISVQTHAFA